MVLSCFTKLDINMREKPAKTKTAQTKVTWPSPSLPHTCADQQHQPPDSSAPSVTPAVCTCQCTALCFQFPSSEAMGSLSYFIPHATRQLLAHALFSLYFLHFQQFAKLKYTHLLNQGHHLEHDQDYKICILSLSEQSASR